MRKKHRNKYFFVRMQKVRAEKIERNRRKRKQNKHMLRRRLRIPSLKDLQHKFLGFQFILAPQNFSLIENAKKMLEFLDRLNKCFENKQKVLVRLENLQRMTTDAIVVLLSSMVRFRSAGIEFNGTYPADRNISQILINSGFFKYLYSAFERGKEDYEFNKISSRIYTHGNKTVSSSLADELIKNASQSLWGTPRRCQGAQKTLVELMHNTFDHASINKGEKHWWLSVEHVKRKNEVVFSFIDFGMGIYRSLENKPKTDPLRDAWEHLKHLNPFARSQVELIKLILEGQLHKSQSGDYYRGKGLAKIYELQQTNKISSLCIISNNSYINVAENDYHYLNKEFQGTFISFKINQNTISLPWQI